MSLWVVDTVALTNLFGCRPFKRQFLPRLRGRQGWKVGMQTYRQRD